MVNRYAKIIIFWLYCINKNKTKGGIVLCIPPLTAGPGRGYTAVCLGCCTRPGNVILNVKLLLLTQKLIAVIKLNGMLPVLFCNGLKRKLYNFQKYLR